MNDKLWLRIEGYERKPISAPRKTSVESIINNYVDMHRHYLFLHLIYLVVVAGGMHDREVK